MKQAGNATNTAEKFLQNNQRNNTCLIKVYKKEMTMNKELTMIGLMFDAIFILNGVMYTKIFDKVYFNYVIVTISMHLSHLIPKMTLAFAKTRPVSKESPFRI